MNDLTYLASDHKAPEEPGLKLVFTGTQTLKQIVDPKSCFPRADIKSLEVISVMNELVEGMDVPLKGIELPIELHKASDPGYIQFWAYSNLGEPRVHDRELRIDVDSVLMAVHRIAQYAFPRIEFIDKAVDVFKREVLCDASKRAAYEGAKQSLFPANESADRIMVAMLMFPKYHGIDHTEFSLVQSWVDLPTTDEQLARHPLHLVCADSFTSFGGPSGVWADGIKVGFDYSSWNWKKLEELTECGTKSFELRCRHSGGGVRFHREHYPYSMTEDRIRRPLNNGVARVGIGSEITLGKDRYGDRYSFVIAKN